MDADNSPVRRAAPAQGGTVEPANRAPVAIERFQTPTDTSGERFEMRDPFAEVTYRASTFPEMVAKADQVGSTRIVAVAEDGKRTPIQKVDGEWQRGQQRPAAPERPLDPLLARDEVSEVTNVVPMPGAAKALAQPEQVYAKAIAKIDAQAERAALVARLEAALMDRYVIKRAPVTMGDVTIGRTEYRFRGDTSRVAFTESTFRLATDTNSPSIARSMVDVAEARNWKALRVSGNEDFKRMVWLEASVRGVKTLGYEPNPALTYAFSIGSDRGFKADDSEARIIAGQAKRRTRVNRIDKPKGPGIRAGRETLGMRTGGRYPVDIVNRIDNSMRARPPPQCKPRVTRGF